MARSLSELKQLCQDRGISVVQSGSRESKSDYEEALREAIWEEQYPGKSVPPQHEPMLAFDFKNLVPGKMNKNDPDPNRMMADNSGWAAQEKKQGCRLLLHIGRPSEEYGVGNWIHSRRISDETYRLNDNSGCFSHITKINFPAVWLGAVMDGEGLSSRPDINTGDTITRDVEKATIALTNSSPEKSMKIQAEQGYMKVHIFDCLFTKGGQDIRKWPYSKRVAEAEKFVRDCEAIGIENIEFLPLVHDSKEQYYNDLVEEGKEGIMLKDMNAPYEHKRSRAVYKRKKFIEIDGWISGFVKSDPDSGWGNLIGALEFSCFTETGAIHMFAACANVTLEERKLMTVQGPNGPELNPSYLGKIAAIRGMEWSSRQFRLTNARIQRWREGMDGKQAKDCVIDLAAIKADIESRGEG